jgi:hypothetical protein
VRVQEIYSPGKASAETSPVATGKADREIRLSNGPQRGGARTAFESALDGLATLNTAGSGRGAWETLYCEPLGAAFLAGCPGFQITKKTMVGYL